MPFFLSFFDFRCHLRRPRGPTGDLPDSISGPHGDLGGGTVSPGNSFGALSSTVWLTKRLRYIFSGLWDTFSGFWIDFLAFLTVALRMLASYWTPRAHGIQTDTVLKPFSRKKSGPEKFSDNLLKQSGAGWLFSPANRYPAPVSCPTTSPGPDFAWIMGSIFRLWASIFQRFRTVVFNN